MDFPIPAGWDDAIYLEQNPDVRACMARDAAGSFKSGYDHYLRFGILEGRPPAWKGQEDAHWGISLGDFEIRFRDANLPEWACEEAFRLSSLDPGLFFNDWKAASEWVPTIKAQWGDSLHQLCATLPEKQFDYLFFFPWLRRGGADLAGLLHIQAAIECGGTVGVVLTEPGDSEWLSQLPQSAHVIRFGELLGGLPLDDQAYCVFRLIASLRPRKVHVINSHAAWRMLTNYSRAASTISDLYVSLYCYDQLPSGEPLGYALQIRQCAPSIRTIFTDNSWFAQHLIADLGLPLEKISVLYHPIRGERSHSAASPHSNRIIWAGRLDRQKRPNLLADIADLLPSLQFDVFGSAVLNAADEAQILQRFESSRNINYMGAFDEVAPLVRRDHRLLLYTAAWDGLPNLVLEFMNAGSLVVVPAIGGIASDLGGKNCILVDAKDSARAYADAIKTAYANPDKTEAIQMRGTRMIHERHTPARFRKSLMGAGYLPPLHHPIPDEVRGPTSRRRTRISHALIAEPVGS